MRRMYSKKQIEAIAKYVAQYDLSDVDLKVKTLEQSEASITDNDAFEFPTGMENITGYKALKVINGVLWIILSISFSTSAEYSAGGTPAFNVKIPSSLRSKIFDINGKTLEDAVETATDIYIFPYARLANGSINTASCRLQNPAGSEPRTKLFLQFYSTGWTASQSNNAVFIRIPLLIL